MRYSWRTPIFDVADADKVGSELADIKLRHGGILTPEAVVAHAHNGESELHKLFEWDDSKAAAQQRRATALSIVRNLRIVVTKDEGVPQFRRVYVHVRKTPSKPAGFLRIEEVNEDERYARQVIATAARELSAWIERYKELRDRLPIAFASVESGLAGISAAEQAD
jgi:hypothetical protein